MKKIIKFVSILMAGVMSFFSPVNVSHGDSGCCAECTFKREDELEVVYDEEDDIGGGNE